MANNVKRGKKGQRISELIGDEYKDWKPHEKYFISAPTGSGKTYFILNVLLPYVASQNKKIVYFVNRKILKEQLEAEIQKLSIFYQSAIKVQTYQSLEQYIQEHGFKNVTYTYPAPIASPYKPGPVHIVNKEKFEPPAMMVEYDRNGFPHTIPGYRYDYAICDECHYFLTDSNYNKNTGLSFRFIMEYFAPCTTVFMSATIDDIFEYVNNACEHEIFEGTQYYQFRSASVVGEKLVSRSKLYRYEIPRDYDFVDVHFINKDQISECILEHGNDKWLIFVDSIEYGKQLEKNLKQSFKSQNDKEQKGKDLDSQVVFLSSGYNDEEGGREQVSRIKSNNKFDAKVLISTAVMDNGINIKDEELRNVIVIADTETEFIQMLGRKRQDGQQVQLYILRQNKNHFQKRLDNIQRTRNFISPYLKELIDNVNNPQSESNFVNDYNAIELELIIKYHNFVTQKVEVNSSLDLITQVYMAYNGIFFLNMLSVKNLKNQYDYFSDIVEEFNSDDNAFARRQLSWLGIPEKEADEIIEYELLTVKEKVCTKFEDMLDAPMFSAEAGAFKDEMREDLRLIVNGYKPKNKEEESAKSTVLDTIGKNKRPLSEQNMDFLRECCGIPFIVKVQEGSKKEGTKTTYTFEKTGADVND